MNKTIIISCELSASNDYMSDVGLRIALDEPLAAEARVHLEALAQSVRDVAALPDSARVIETSEFPDSDPQPEYITYFVGANGAAVALMVDDEFVPRNEPVFAHATITRAQRDLLHGLIRGQLALCLLTLGLDVVEANPYAH